MVWTRGAQGNLAPSLIALFDQADDGWPFRSKLSDGSLGDPDHASRTSDHNPKPPNPPGWVDAGDLTEDHANGPDLPALWDHLIATRDQRVKYAIYEARIVKSYVDSAGRPAWVPQPYTGPNAHTQHMHISVTPEGRLDTSPWFPEEDVVMTPEQEAMLAEVRGEVRNIRATGINTEAAVVNSEKRLINLEARVAHLASIVGGDDVDEAEIARQILAGLGDVTLSDEQVRSIIDAIPGQVKQALREGTG